MTARPQPADPHTLRAAIGELRFSWWMLGESLPAGSAPGSWLERHLSPEQEAAESAQVRKDRHAAAEALKAGRAGAGPRPDVARVSAVVARVDVARRLTVLAGTTASTILGQRIPDPAARTTTGICWPCAGRGDRIQAATAALPAMPGSVLAWAPCPDCAGTGRTAPPPCWLCGATGRCRCDHCDATVALLLDDLDRRAEQLDGDQLQHAVDTVTRVDQTCRRAARITGDVDLVLKARCPACGARDLVAMCRSPKPSDWQIRCRNDVCQCAGHACPCGCPTRYAGKRHVWPARDGVWHDLAARLGVTTTDLVGEVLRHRPSRAGSTMAGKGGRS